MKRPQKPTTLEQILHSFWHDQSGFSLAEILVAAGMLGVLSLGVTQLMQNSKKTEKRLGQQVNIISIDGEIREALRNPVGCGRTLRAAAVSATSTAATDMSVGDWTDVPDNRIYRSNLQNLTDADANRWGIVAEQWVDASSNVGVYGDGSNTITVHSIQYRGFYTGTGTVYGDSALYANPGVDPTSMSVIAGTTEAIGQVVIKVEFTRGNYARFEGLTPTEQQKMSSGLVSGPFRLVRYYPVRVRVNEAEPQTLIRCLTNNDDILSQYCSAMGGYMDEVDGRCKNIKITDAPDTAGAPLGPNQDEDNEFAIAAQRTAGENTSGKIIAESGMVVGYEDDPADTATTYIAGIYYDAATGAKVPFTADDNQDFDPDFVPDRSLMVERDIIADQDIFAHRSLNVGIHHPQNEMGGPVFPGGPNGPGRPAAPFRAVDWGDAAIGKDIQIGRNVTAGGFFNLGAPAVPATVNGEASISNNLRVDGAVNVGNVTTPETVPGRMLVREKITLGQADADTAGGTSLHVGAGTSQFVRNDRRIRINDAGLMNFDDAGNERMRIRTTGQLSFFDGTGNDVLQIGAGVGNYRPISIWNQPMGSATMNFSNGSAAGREVPTKEWVRRLIYGSITDTDPNRIATIVDNIVDYAQHNELDVIKRDMCQSIRLDTYAAANQAECVWNSGAQRCTCENSNCGRAGTQPNGFNMCNDITVNGVLAANQRVVSPRFHTADRAAPPAGYMRASFLEARGNGLSIYAQDRIEANGDIISGRYLISQNRVCTQGSGGIYYCFTKFGKHVCRNQGFMIGVAYGHPICARSGGGAAGVTRL